MSTAQELVDEGKSSTHASARVPLERLREMGAPDPVVESVDRRLMPPPERPRGIITHNLHGSEMAKQRTRTRESLRDGKPKAYEALRASGLPMREVRRGPASARRPSARRSTATA
jgi:hypothetical protein